MWWNPKELFIIEVTFSEFKMIPDIDKISLYFRKNSTAT